MEHRNPQKKWAAFGTAVLFAVLFLSTRAAGSDPFLSNEKRPPNAAAVPTACYQNSASFSFFSLFGPGITLEYERFVKEPSLSFVSGLGFRATGGNDYETLTLTPSMEVHLWLSNVVPFLMGTTREMAGFLLAFREDVAFTKVENKLRNQLAGNAIEVAETLSVGYRFYVWRVHATPLLGGTVTTALDPSKRLAPHTFLSGKLAITFGVLF